MVNENIKELIESFVLNKKQHQAALERDRDVVVTAGAGSGKTLTLVARYVGLLAEGIPPRRIAAVTFSIKAAREMRSRVRSKLLALSQTAEDEGERQKWLNLTARMDSARIGTIHGLCAEILRAHPAEAAIDPRFEVLDEGLAAALRSQAVEDTLKIYTDQERFIPLLSNIEVIHLHDLFADILNKRLEADNVLAQMVDQQALLTRELHDRMTNPLIVDLIYDLRTMPKDELEHDAGKALALMVSELLELWDAANRAFEDEDLIACATHLYQIRRSKMNGGVGKKDSIVKGIVADLRGYFENLICPLTGGVNSKDPLPSSETEALMGDLLAILREAFNILLSNYQDLLESRHALDFDDLEGRACALMKDKHIRQHWQNEIDAILVDEFQDTNHRQRQIIEALADKPGKLFIVGDMRQSIYRFRQADVTVFGEVQDRIRQEGGLLIDLDLTYRAHQPLLDGMGDILSAAIGTSPDPTRPYYVPYTPMVAHKEIPPENIFSPHVEFIFGAGEDADAAQPLSARLLAQRLMQLKESGQIKLWDEVALLFRASTGFPDYEEALQAMAIPFVTVSGRGFYDRAEIRDLLTILRALADPNDDLSFTGLLRSPAFGLSDAALFLLRQNGQSYWSALQENLSDLEEDDQIKGLRTKRILDSLLPLVDRIPVAELLKHTIDALDYRAILATADRNIDEQDIASTGGRLYRNLDKLLDDALASQQVSVINYLDMIKTLNEVGAREGEAPAEAEGAVRLMTIHKAKGLEFNVVVLAAASRGTRSSSEWAYLSPNLGVTLKLDPPPMLYNLSKFLDKDQDDMEELRLLYVALTRAKHKLIINGYTKPKKDGILTFTNWAKKLVEAAGLDTYLGQSANEEPFECETPSSHPLYVWCAWNEDPSKTYKLTEEKLESEQNGVGIPLYHPIEDEFDESGDEDKDQEIDRRKWLVTEGQDMVPGDILGTMVHKAIELRLSPDNPQLNSLLDTTALNAGLVAEKGRSIAIEKSHELLGRLYQHPIWQTIKNAVERHHELPFTTKINHYAKTGIIDLLFRDEHGWHILDFKTDPIDSFAHKEELLQKYGIQLKAYHKSVKGLLDIDADMTICFLDDHESISLVEVL